MGKIIKKMDRLCNISKVEAQMLKTTKDETLVDFFGSTRSQLQTKHEEEKQQKKLMNKGIAKQKDYIKRKWLLSW